MEYGRYRIVKELGKGTMGVVYEAHDPQIDRLVALKILRPDRMVNEAYVGRFLKEARAIGRLSHPSIVTIYDVGEDNDTIYIAMEYLKGKPFDEVIRSGSLSVAQSIDIARQVAEALDYAHKQAIIHRDIKPSNIILTDDYKVKLTDFGIARIEDSATLYQTKAGEILGTPVYMSPEQAMGQTVDGRSDLYALGVILYELIVGRRPFTGNNIAAILRAITQDTPESPVDADPFIPAVLSDLIMKSIAKDPSERYQTGRQMADALASTVIPSEATAPPAGKEKKPAAAPAGGRKTIAIVAALVIAVCIAVGVYFLFTGNGTDLPPDSQLPTQNETSAAPPTDEPKQKPAVLVINSEPEGAQIYVNGEFKGKTPTELTLPLGKYEVRLNLTDHLEWAAQVDLDASGQTQTLHVPLRALN